MDDVRAMQLADRKSDAYRHVFETVVSDCLEEGLVGGLDFTVDVSLRPTPIASSPSPARIEMLFAHRKRLPYPIVTHNVGNVDSIATAVFVGGRDRYACPASTFMFHGVGFAGNANERLEENNLKAKLDTALADHRRISGIFAARTQTRLSVKAAMNLFKEQRTRNAQWALDNGIIAAIRDFTLPAGAKVHFLVQ